MTYEQAWNLPIELRKWWIKRVSKEVEKKNKTEEAAAKGKGPPGR